MTPKTLRKKWIAALRSGKYKRACGELTDGVGYCCLGVACQVAINEGLVQERVLHNRSAVLGKKMKALLGLKSFTGKFIDSKGEKEDLTNLNDNKLWSFKKIAALIEKEPKGLFK